jgi:hypothetical protein
MTNKKIKGSINLLFSEKTPKNKTIIPIAIFSEIATEFRLNERIIKDSMIIIKDINIVKIAIPKIE